VRHGVVAFLVAVAGCGPPVPSAAHAQANASAASPRIRHELEQWYAANRRAFLARDLTAIMALRTPDFHTITPDGAVSDRAMMEQRTRAFLAGLEEWIAISEEIDSLVISDNQVRSVTRQHLVRRALRGDGVVHHVETWVTQHETFRSTPKGWQLFRVDSLRDQRRLVDGRPG
jgi:hypothetical protein